MRHKLTVSVTELLSFEGCRRRWYLGRMYGGRTSTPALWFGTGVHKGLECYFTFKKMFPNDLGGQQKAMQEGYMTWARDQYLSLSKEYNMVWEQAEGSIVAMLDLGEQILNNYIEYDRTAAIGLRPLMVEKRLFIPISEDGKDVLTLRMDLVARTDSGLLAIVDHKTSSGLHATGPTLDLDEQGTGYSYGFYRLTKRERTADAFVYDVLAKKVPAEPRVLKNGNLSKDVSQDTTYEKMLHAIRANGQKVEDYAEILYVLEEKGWSSYFSREISPRNLDQVLNYEWRAQYLFQQMREVIADPRKAIPSPSDMKCRTCPFLQVCTNMEMGEDYQQALNDNFTRHGKTAWTLPPRYKEKTG